MEQTKLNSLPQLEKFLKKNYKSLFNKHVTIEVVSNLIEHFLERSYRYNSQYTYKFNTTCDGVFDFNFKKTNTKFNLKQFNIDGNRPYELQLCIDSLVDNNILSLFYNYKNFGDEKCNTHYRFSELFLKQIEDVEIYKGADINNYTPITDDEKKLYTFLKTNTRLKCDVDEVLEEISEVKHYTYSHLCIIRKGLEKFINKQHWVKQDPKTNRIYSSFSSLPRLAREYVQIKNSSNQWENIKGVDLKCANVFFVANIIKSERLSALVRQDFYQWLVDNQPSDEYKEKHVKMAKNGEYDITWGYVKRLTRSDIKPDVMRFMFREKTDNNILVHKILADNEPNILKAITKLRNDCKGNLWKVIQSTEARIFNEIWWINSKWSLPLCDSVYIMESKFDKVLEYMKSVFLREGFDFSDSNVDFE